MKKFTLLLVLALALVLTACGNSQDEDSTNKDTSEVETETNETEVNENEENGSTTEESTETVELYEIEFNEDTNAIELKKEGEDPIVLSADGPSGPEKSPNGEQAVYLAPFEWEALSDLYLVDLKNGEQKKLVAANQESKPKKVLWQDDEHVLVIIGFPYGTVSVGGNIYKVNVETGEQEAVTNYEDDIQITDFHIEDSTLHYSGIQYTDEEMNDHKDYANQVELD